MFTLLALPFATAQKWLDSLSLSELLVLVGVIAVSIALGVREAKEHRDGGGFGGK
jgi:hypothetical protein